MHELVLRFMVFSRQLYLGNGIKHPALIKHKLRCRRLSRGTFVLRIAENDTDYLEILDASYYLQPLAHLEKNYIVGFAASYEEALELVKKMLQDSLEETGEANLRAYLMSRNRREVPT